MILGEVREVGLGNRLLEVREGEVRKKERMIYGIVLDLGWQGASPR